MVSVGHGEGSEIKGRGSKWMFNVSLGKLGGKFRVARADITLFGSVALHVTVPNFPYILQTLINPPLISLANFSFRHKKHAGKLVLLN
jgi:hypothetical protein